MIENKTEASKLVDRILSEKVSELQNSFSIAGFYSLLDYCIFSQSKMSDLIACDEFKEIIKNEKFTFMLLSSSAYFPIKKKEAVSDSRSGGGDRDLYELMLKSAEQEEETRVFVKGRVEKGETDYDFFSSARPFSNIFSRFKKDPGKEISKDILSFISGKQHFYADRLFSMSKDECFELSSLIASTFGLQADLVLRVIYPPEGAVSEVDLITLYEEKPFLAQALVNRHYPLGWEYTESFIALVTAARIHGIEEDHRLAAGIAQEISGFSDYPCISLAPDVWLSFMACAWEHIDRWEDTSVEMALRARIIAVTSYLLEAPVEVTTPNLVSDISGALIPYHICFRATDEEYFHPVAMLLSRYYDEASPYDAWDRTDKNLSPVDSEYRYDEYMLLIDSCISWRLWDMADCLLSFYILSDYIIRECLPEKRLDLVTRLEVLCDAGCCNNTINTLGAIVKEKPYGSGPYHVYLKRFEIDDVSPIDQFSKMAVRNISMIPEMSNLSEKFSDLIFSAEYLWCANAHKTGVEKADWGSVAIDYFRAVEAEMKWRFLLIANKLKGIDRKMMPNWHSPTGGQINRLILDVSEGRGAGAAEEIVCSVFDVHRDKDLWKEMAAFWKLRNKASHGGQDGFEESDVILLRNKLYSEGLLKRFCAIFGAVAQ